MWTQLTVATNERLLGRPPKRVKKNRIEATQSKSLREMIKIVQSGSVDVIDRTLQNCNNGSDSKGSPFVASRYRRGDVFSAQELQHLPVISTGACARAQTDVSMPKGIKPVSASPPFFSLVTPEKRPGPRSNCSSNLSKSSFGFASLMPSPSKLFFSPTKQVFSPMTSPPKCIGEFYFTHVQPFSIL